MLGVRFDGAEASRPAPGVLEAIAAADVVLIAPSNPFISIGPILAVPGIRDAVAARRERAVAVSPIVAGQALRGPAAAMLAHARPRDVRPRRRPPVPAVAGTLLLDRERRGAGAGDRGAGLRPLVTGAVMRDHDAAGALAAAALGRRSRVATSS